MNKTKMFILASLALAIVGCTLFSNHKTTPTMRDAICNDVKTKLLFYSTTPGMQTNQNQIDPAQQAELMKTYQKYNCDEVSK